MSEYLSQQESSKSDAFDIAVGQFRESVREWSDFQYRPAALQVPKKHMLLLNRFRSQVWIHAPALALALLLICLFSRYGSQRTGASKERAISDSALASLIDQQTAETIPSALQPLERSSN